MTGSMRLRGDELLVADTPELRVLASPDIVLRAGPDGYEVEGDVLIPNARISPRELTTHGEHVTGRADRRARAGRRRIGEPDSTDRVTSRIKVTLGDAVRVDAYGLKARLEGDVTVSTVPDDVARGNGVIRVAEGQYKAFGQDVTITRGTLTYNNTPLNEPMLDIVAERKIKDADITVAVNVRGTIDRPFISITSQPAMPSNEALSYLLTGRSIDTLQSGEAANVNQAAENLAVSGGGLLLGELGTRLGLDEVSVERTRRRRHLGGARQGAVAELVRELRHLDRGGHQHDQAALHAERALVGEGRGGDRAERRHRVQDRAVRPRGRVGA